MDKGIHLRKELAMGLPGAVAEASGKRDRGGKFAKGGLVKTNKTCCAGGKMKSGGKVGKKGCK